MNNLNNDDIRSEKVRKILGEILSSLVKCGNILILILFMLLIFVLAFVPNLYSNQKESILHYFIYNIFHGLL